MTEPQGGFRLPQRRVRTETAPERVPPVLLWQVASVPGEPRAARGAREAMTACLPAAGAAPGSVFADAPRSPVTDVRRSVAAGHLIVSVADTEPLLPDLTPEGPPPTATGGARPADGHDGKVVFVRFGLPSYDGSITGSGKGTS
ncbi:ATP-binding protein [Streptomyces niveiscabiei]|uniref:ATP-binding protein n=1 Tax=Streptomyces niveiscabiei TaxID=164115 RepID=UPI0029B00918|nr:ATP-binding protein [Streptomyces niveiscabiei]MDX3386283.1 ATP-binding protein [Streptomyces niveiscabiei]